MLLIVLHLLMVIRLGGLLQMLDIIHKDAPDSFQEGSEVAMLVNNLGSTTLMELYIMANAALAHAQDKLKVTTDSLPETLCIMQAACLGVPSSFPSGALQHCCEMVR